MNDKSLQTRQRLASQDDALPGHSSPGGSPYAGHAHGSDRGLSRRKFFKTMAGAAGIAAGYSLWSPAWGDGSAAPRPIPETITPFHLHLNLPGPADQGHEPSTITDFGGFIGVADLKLSGTGTDTSTGATTPYTFHTDWRFMQGIYIGLDGRPHRGTFSFI